MKKILCGLAMLAVLAEAQTTITTPLYSITFRQGWTANPNPAPNPNSRAMAQRDFGATIAVFPSLDEKPEVTEEALYTSLASSRMTETIERAQQRLGDHTFTVTEWKDASSPNTRNRMYVTRRPGFIFLGSLTYNISPDLCCVAVADADAAMETLKLDASVAVRRPSRLRAPALVGGTFWDGRNLLGRRLPVAD